MLLLPVVSYLPCSVVNVAVSGLSTRPAARSLAATYVCVCSAVF